MSEGKFEARSVIEEYLTVQAEQSAATGKGRRKGGRDG